MLEQEGGPVEQSHPCCRDGGDRDLTKGQGRVTRKLTRRPRGVSRLSVQRLTRRELPEPE